MTIIVDPQDPLPEPTWGWRRFYVYVVTVVILVLVWLGVTRLAEAAMMDPSLGIAALLDAVKWLIASLICVITYYLIAPSAEQIVKMIQAARIKRVTVEAEKDVATSSVAQDAATAQAQLDLGTSPSATPPKVAPTPKREPPENAPWA